MFWPEVIYLLPIYSRKFKCIEEVADRWFQQSNFVGPSTGNIWDIFWCLAAMTSIRSISRLIIRYSKIYVRVANGIQRTSIKLHLFWNICLSVNKTFTAVSAILNAMDPGSYQIWLSLLGSEESVPLAWYFSVYHAPYIGNQTSARVTKSGWNSNTHIT